MPYQHEQELAERWMGGCNNIVADMYNSGPVPVKTKPDGTRVTSINEKVSDYVVNQGKQCNQLVLSEEDGSTAKHGDNGMFVVDPVDGTDDVIAGQTRPRRGSIAGPSIGYWDKEPVVGVVGFPLLSRNTFPIIYSARKGAGTIRRYRNEIIPLQVNNQPTKGIVFITIKQNKEAAQLAARLREMGYTPLAQDGAVYKACALVDSFLLVYSQAYLALNAKQLPVGFISTGVHLHDVAATTCIIREAGGVTTEPLNRPGKQLWAAANNSSVLADMVLAARP